MTHTPTPWRLFNAPVTNNKFLRKIGPLIIGETASDEDVMFAADAINSHASLVEENKRMREALEYARKGLNMVHYGLMDPTRPRQSVGEVCAHFLQASNKALGDTNA